MRTQVLLFSIIFLLYGFGSSAYFVKVDPFADIKTNFINVFKSFDILNEKVDEILEKIDQKIISNASNIDEPVLTLEMNSTVNENKTSSDVCHPNPCLNGGRCEYTLNGSDYQCKQCFRPTSGKNCENLNCGGANKCFQKDGTMFAVFEVNGTWEEANRKCANEEMILAQPKDKNITEFAINQLKTMYDSNNTNLQFWIGLKGHKYGWQWVDGSPLKDYTGESPSFKSFTHQYCGFLYLYGGHTMWYSRKCTSIASYQLFYPICEKRMSIRFR